jgi:NAD(P)-dependent dehydrogenase (short-subunit alcohol dehydrogenase family)
MGERLAGKVIAVIGRGTPGNRAVAVALAEDGADVAIATMSPSPVEEFATASIANEVWAIGRRQLSHVLDAGDPSAIERFAHRIVDELGGCDAILGIGDGPVDTAAFARVFPAASVVIVPETHSAGMVAIARHAASPTRH